MTSRASSDRAGQTVTVRVPLALRRRGGRRLVLAPAGQPPRLQRTRVDGTMVKALARAHRWKALLESGRYATVVELAEAEKINESYLCRVLRITLLAPWIIEEILDGRQPASLQLARLLRPLPVAWESQRILFSK